MPKRSGETVEAPNAHNFQSNPEEPSVWIKKPKLEDAAGAVADSDSDDEVNVEAEPEYRSATLPVMDGKHALQR